MTKLGRGPPKDHFCKILLNSDQWFQRRRFLKFSLNETGHAPWRPCFSYENDNFNKSERLSPEDYSCKIILNSDHWFMRRRCFSEKLTPDDARQTTDDARLTPDTGLSKKLTLALRARWAKNGPD